MILPVLDWRGCASRLQAVVLVLATFAAIVATAAQPAVAEKRVALVIGNSQYQHTTPLANPRNDAVAIAAALKRLNFEVVTALDLAYADTHNPIREFVSLLPGADVALFFYAGHGLSFEGKN